MRKIIVILLVFTPVFLQAQASWNHALYFHLYDAEGEELKPENFQTGDVALWVPTGYYTRQQLKWDSSYQCFQFSQTVVVGGGEFLFVTGSDSTIVHFGTFTTYIDKIQLNPGYWTISPSETISPNNPFYPESQKDSNDHYIYEYQLEVTDRENFRENNLKELILVPFTKDSSG
ncbi:MAG: hypothetical protein GYB31_16120 [Bacteroidetes bacterium]|nr:hypothetical protein [Bacteroidota bacterium]